MRPMSVGKKKVSGNDKVVGRFHPELVDSDHMVHIHLITEKGILSPLMKSYNGQKYVKSLLCDTEYTTEI